MSDLEWVQNDEHEWLSTNGRYRLWENDVTLNVFIYLRRSAEDEVLILARYNLADAQAYAQEHADKHPAYAQPMLDHLPARTCEATLALKNHDVLPSCLRAATKIVTIIWFDIPYEIRTCPECASMFTIRPSLKAQVRDA